MLGPSHHYGLDGCALTMFEEYDTPLGILPVDKECNKRLINTGHFSRMSQEADLQEHSLEMQMPYIRKMFERQEFIPKVVPILVGCLSESQEQLYGRILAQELLDPHTLAVISTDFCHWGPRFGYFYRMHHLPHDTPIHTCIETLDHTAMSIIQDFDIRAFKEYMSATGNTICGRNPISIMMHAAKYSESKWSLRWTKYTQSDTLVSQKGNSVSYVSGYVVIPPSSQAK